MVGLIQKSGFIKPGKAAGYIEYIATRDGVEKIGSDARYQLGKLYLTSDDAPKDTTKALEYLTEAAEQSNSQAQYILGKLYLLGNEVEQNKGAAVQWLTLAAAQDNEYAQFFLDHMKQDRDPSVLICATRLLCHMAQIIRDTPPPAPPTGLVIDRKRFQQLMEKKIAMGHKPDDHEEQGYVGPAM